MVNAVSVDNESASSPPPGSSFDTPFDMDQDESPDLMLASYNALCPGSFKRDADEDNVDADKADASGQADALHANVPQADASVEVRAADALPAKKRRRNRGATGFTRKPKGTV